MKGRNLFFAAALCIVAGCHSVTIRPQGTTQLSSEPTQEVRHDYFLFGIIGETNVDAAKTCGAKRVSQMQAKSTFVDSLLGVVTLGVYTPRSSRIWCE